MKEKKFRYTRAWNMHMQKIRWRGRLYQQKAK